MELQSYKAVSKQYFVSVATVHSIMSPCMAKNVVRGQQQSMDHNKALQNWDHNIKAMSPVNVAQEGSPWMLIKVNSTHETEACTSLHDFCQSTLGERCKLLVIGLMVG